MRDNIYKTVAAILQNVENKTNSIKAQLYNDDNVKQRAQVYKLCHYTLKHKAVLGAIVDNSGICSDEAFADSWYTKVLVYEFLFGKKLLKCSKKERTALECHAQRLQKEKKRLEQEGVIGIDGKFVEENNLPLAEPPRYVRVNRLIASVDEVRGSLENDGWCIVEPTTSSRKTYNDFIQKLVKPQVSVDMHFDDIFVFPPATNLYRNEMCDSSKLVLQDKSSYLPVACLNPPPGSVVLDACAAPGMKTTHIAALLGNNGTIIAIDRSWERTETMKQLLKKYHVACARCFCADFLSVDPKEAMFEQVEYILVDAPCSGSGIVRRRDELTDDAESKSHKRISSLSNLQAMILKHALSFPNVKRVVYSTCSVTELENEVVVQEALESQSGRNFQLVKALPFWKHRGIRKYPFASLVLRASFEKDLTNGFFVAMFERK